MSTLQNKIVRKILFLTNLFLGKYWAKILMLLGLCVAVFNMLVGWSLVLFAISALHVPPNINLYGGPNEFMSNMASVANGVTYLLSKLLDNTSGSANIFSSILILAFSFSLAGIGFSLLVMGIQAATDASVRTKKMGFYFRTTSPGIVCIGGATLLMLVLLLKDTSLLTHSPPKLSSEQMKADAVAQLISAKAYAIETEAEAKALVLKAEAETKKTIMEKETNEKIYLMEQEAKIHNEYKQVPINNIETQQLGR